MALLLCNFLMKGTKDMGLLCDEVEIGVTGRSAVFYENLGYEIPKYIYKDGTLRVKNGTKIVVKVKDLSFGSSAAVLVKCDRCGKEYMITYNNYNRVLHDGKIYCRECSTKLFKTGENHPCYKKEKTKEERELKRLYPEYIQFVKRVLKRDDYTCQCCGKKLTKNLEVHHLDGYDWCVEKRTDDTNGITLCENCHSNFHSIYGRGGNTKEQFENWIGYALDELEKFDGELSFSRKVYCYEEDKIYNSANEFIRIHKLKAPSTVYYVCNRQYHCKTIKGMHLFWYDKYITMPEEEVLKLVNEPSWKNSKKVICLTTNMIYSSIAEGARKEQASKTSITRCCCNEAQYVRTKDGRITQWKYYEDYLVG